MVLDIFSKWTLKHPLIIGPLFPIPVIDAAIIPHRIAKKDAEGLSAFAIIINNRKIIRIADLS